MHLSKSQGDSEDGCSLETARINVRMPVTCSDCPSAGIHSAENQDKVTCWRKRWGNILNKNFYMSWFVRIRVVRRQEELDVPSAKGVPLANFFQTR